VPSVDGAFQIGVFHQHSFKNTHAHKFEVPPTKTTGIHPPTPVPQPGAAPKRKGRPARDLNTTAERFIAEFHDAEPTNQKFWGSEAPALIRNTKNLLKDLDARIKTLTGDERSAMEARRKAVDAVMSCSPTGAISLHRSSNPWVNLREQPRALCLIQ
jgi:hypothetical protein